MKKLLAIFGVLATVATVVHAQGSNGGLLYASDFAQWTLPQGSGPASGTIQWTSPGICTVGSNGYNFVAPKVGRPITIVDNNPALTETVVPTQVTINNATCTMLAPMANVHFTYHLQSGTGGAQEAIDYQATWAYGSLVILTPAWTEVGGSTGMISGFHGQTSTSLLDERTSCLDAYDWNGTNYVSVGTCSGGGSGNVTGTGTGGYLPIWTGSGASTALGNSPNDYGVTTANVETISAPVQINSPTGASGTWWSPSSFTCPVISGYAGWCEDGSITAGTFNLPAPLTGVWFGINTAGKVADQLITPGASGTEFVSTGPSTAPIWVANPGCSGTSGYFPIFGGTNAPCALSNLDQDVTNSGSISLSGRNLELNPTGPANSGSNMASEKALFQASGWNTGLQLTGVVVGSGYTPGQSYTPVLSGQTCSTPPVVYAEGAATGGLGVVVLNPGVCTVAGTIAISGSPGSGWSGTLVIANVAQTSLWTMMAGFTGSTPGTANSVLTIFAPGRQATSGLSQVCYELQPLQGIQSTHCFNLDGAPGAFLAESISELTAARTASWVDASGDIAQFIHGTPINNDCAKWLVSGSVATLGDAGAACGSGGGTGITGVLGEPIIGATSTTGTSQPDYFDVASYSGDFCARLSAAFAAANTLFGAYRGTFDGRAFASAQTCSANPFAASAFQTNGTSTPVHVLMPYFPVSATAAWVIKSNNVVIEWQGQGGSSVLQAVSSYPSGTPIITIGDCSTFTNLNSGNQLWNGKVSNNGFNTGTAVKWCSPQEYSGDFFMDFIGNNDSGATAATVQVINGQNMEPLYHSAVTGSGDNPGIEISGNSTSSFENLSFDTATLNNTGIITGTAGIKFDGTSFLSHAVVHDIHCEGFVDCVESGANVMLGGSLINSTGTMTNTLLIDSGTCGGVNVQLINDAGSGTTNLVNDLACSTTVTVAGNSYGGHAGIKNYPVFSTGSGSSYTNVIASASGDTTVAAINAKCTGGQTYWASIPLSIATGGTIGAGCNVMFVKGALWTIASGQTVTFTNGVEENDGPSQHFTGSGTVALSAYNSHVPVEWFGAIGYATPTLAASGTNSLTTIQTTLNSISSGCAQLQGQAYQSTGTLTISVSTVGICGTQNGYHSSVTGVGNGLPSILVSTSASTDQIDFGGTSSIYTSTNNFTDFSLQRTVTPTGTAAGISCSFAGGALVQRVQVNDSVRSAYIHACPSFGGGKWADNQFAWGAAGTGGYSSGSYYGMYLDSADGFGENSVRLERNTIANKVGGTITTYGVIETGEALNDVSSYGLETSAVSYPVYLHYTGSGTGNASADIRFTDSILDDCLASCVYVNGLTYATGGSVTFNGGWFNPDTSDTSPVVDIESSSGIAVNNVQIVQLAGATYTYGVLANSSSNIQINNNNINNMTPTYVIALENTNDSTVVGNSIVSAPGPTSQIYLSGTSSHNVISGNTQSGYSTNGIQFGSSATNNTLDNQLNIDPTHITTAIVDAGTNNRNQTVNNLTVLGTCTGCSTGFPFTLGSTSIAGGSTTTAVGGLSVNGVTLTTGGTSTTYLNGTGTYTTPSGGGGSYPTPEIHTASNSASLAFTTCITSANLDYQIRVTNLVPATATNSIYLQFSTNGGSTWDTSSSYSYGRTYTEIGSTGGSSTGASSTSGFDLTFGGTGGSGILAANPLEGEFILHNPLGTTNQKSAQGTITLNSGSQQYNNPFGFLYQNANAVNAFQIISASGNLTTGTVTCQPLP